MKTIPWLVLLVVLNGTLSLSAAGPEGAGEKILRERTDKLSIRLLLNEMHKGFAQKVLVPGTARIRQEMQKDPKHNLRTDEARKHAAVWLDDELRRQYRKQAEQIVNSFTGTLTGNEKKEILSGEKNFFEKMSRELLNPVFQRARTDLVQEQKKQVFKKIYPTPDELESLPDPKLTALLTDRFRKGLTGPLWEENEKLVGKELIQPVIASGRKQQKMQLEQLRRESVPGSIWDAAAAEKHLEGELLRAMTLAVPDADARYGLFPASKKEIRNRAARLSVDRVISALPNTIQTEQYLIQLKNRPQDHLTPDASFRKIRPETERQLMENAARQAGVPAALQKSLMQNPEIREAAEKRFRELCSSVLLNVRRDFAKQQMQTYWPKLAEGKWSPAMPETEDYAASGSVTVPRIKDMPEKKNLLKETEELTEQELRKALSLEVIRLEKQKTAVNKVYQTVLDAMEKEQQMRNAQNDSWLASIFSASSDVQLDEIIKAYQKKVIEASSKPLFPLVVTEIEVRARAILQRIRNPEQTKTVESPKKERKMVVYAVKITGNGESITLAIDGWRKTFSGGKQAGKEIAAEFRKRMENVKEPTDFQIRLLVKGDRIYYRTVSDLRESLKDELHECTVEDSLQK